MYCIGAIRQAQRALRHVHGGQRRVLGDPGGAEHLDGFVDDANGDIRYRGLDHWDPDAGLLGIHVIHHPGGLQGQQARHLDIHTRIGDDVDIAAQLGQRPAECDAVGRPLAHELQGTLGSTDRPHAVVNPAGAKAALGNFKAAARAENDVLLGHAHIVEFHVHMAMGCIVHGEHVHGPDHFDPGGIHGHQDLRLLQVLGGVRVGFHHGDEDLATGIAGTTDVVLLAVYDPLVTFQLCLGTDIGGIRGRHAGLGHGEGGANLAIQQGLQPLLLLGLAAVLLQDFHVAGVRRRAVEALRRQVGTPHFLRQVGVLNRGEPEAAVALGQEEIPQAQLLRLGLQGFQDLGLAIGPLPAVTGTDFVVVLLLHRDDIVGDELLYLLENGPHSLADPEVHTAFGGGDAVLLRGCCHVVLLPCSSIAA